MQQTDTKRERAILAGLSASSMDEHERSTDVSMEELAALVETAGGETVAMLVQTRPSPDPRSFIGDGKVQEMKELIEHQECDLAVFDNELSPSQMRVPVRGAGGQGAGPQRPDPGHLCPAGPDPGGPAAGGAGPVPVSAAPADGHVDPPEAPGGHQRPHRHPRPRRDPAGDGPPPHPPQDPEAGGGAGAGAPGALHPAPPPGEERHAHGGPGGLHQRGQVHGAQPPDGLGHPGQRPAVRHAGHHHPPPAGGRADRRCCCPTPWALSASCPPT